MVHSASTPDAGDSCSIDLSKAAGTLQLSSDLTMGAIYTSGSGHFSVNGNELTVKKSSTFEQHSGALHILVGSDPGKYILEGPTMILAPEDPVFLKASNNDPGQFLFQDDLYIGPYGRTKAGKNPRLHFDAPGSQSIDAGNNAADLQAGELKFGGQNKPRVSLQGDPADGGTFGVYGGKLKIGTGTYVNAGRYSLDLQAGTSTSILSMQKNATLELGSNNEFPANWPDHELHPSSTTHYNGADQHISGKKDRGIRYWNLKLGNANTTKHADESFTVRGDLLIRDGVTIDAAHDQVYRVKKDFINNGTFVAYRKAKKGSQKDIVSRVSMTGDAVQSIRGTSSPTSFYELVINNVSDKGVKLKTPVQIADAGSKDSTARLLLYDGILHSDSTNLLTWSDGAEANSGGRSNSYVDGPMKKIGDESFIFPSGDGDIWARIEIGAPKNKKNAFTAQYFSDGYEKQESDLTLKGVSDMEYWQLDRHAGKNPVQVSIYSEDTARSGISEAMQNNGNSRPSFTTKAAEWSRKNVTRPRKGTRPWMFANFRKGPTSYRSQEELRMPSIKRS